MYIHVKVYRYICIFIIVLITTQEKSSDPRKQFGIVKTI